MCKTSLVRCSGCKKSLIFSTLESSCKGTGEDTLLPAWGSWTMATTESLPSVHSSGFVFAVRPHKDEEVYSTLCTHTEHPYTARTTASKSLFKMPFFKPPVAQQTKKRKEKEYPKQKFPQNLIYETDMYFLSLDTYDIDHLLRKLKMSLIIILNTSIALLHITAVSYSEQVHQVLSP